MRLLTPQYLIKFEDNLYIMHKSYPEHEKLPIDDIKKHYNCDAVLKKDGRMFFCEKIQEAEYEELPSKA